MTIVISIATLPNYFCVNFYGTMESLIRKYNVPGPRCKSHPFSAFFSQSVFSQKIVFKNNLRL